MQNESPIILTVLILFKHLYQNFPKAQDKIVAVSSYTNRKTHFHHLINRVNIPTEKGRNGRITVNNWPKSRPEHSKINSKSWTCMSHVKHMWYHGASPKGVKQPNPVASTFVASLWDFSPLIV